MRVLPHCRLSCCASNSISKLWVLCLVFVGVLLHCRSIQNILIDDTPKWNDSVSKFIEFTENKTLRRRNIHHLDESGFWNFFYTQRRDCIVPVITWCWHFHDCSADTLAECSESPWIVVEINISRLNKISMCYFLTPPFRADIGWGSRTLFTFPDYSWCFQPLNPSHKLKELTPHPMGNQIRL